MTGAHMTRAQMAKLAVPKLDRDAGNVHIYPATWGVSQNLLGDDIPEQHLLTARRP
jgi:hypothetical protein